MTSKIKVDNINKVSDDSNIINKCGTAINVGASGNTVTVTGNDIRSDSYKAADGGVIASQSGTTITLGASGDTITLASGASQTGFGRTGTVDWQTGSIKTGTFTGESGKGYFVNTTSGAVTGNLPASPTAGDIVAFADYAGTAGTNNITIGRNGSNIEGGASDGTISTNRETKTLVFVDGTQGWVPVNDNFDSAITPAYITATGGSITTVCTDYKVHTFTGPGTFTVCSVGNSAGSNTVDYLVVAGGGGGGATQYSGNNRSGGAGAGGYRESSGAASGCYSTSPLGSGVSALPVSAQGYPITVGAGGPGAYGSGATNGADSIFSTITSAGGGKGAECSPAPTQVAGAGGSGGGSAARGTFAAGNTPPVSPPQGNDGAASTGFNGTGGGGGGAGAAGGTGAGGDGVSSSINGSPASRAGGGGAPGSGPGSGGSGGGGTANGGAGTVNTGGGGAGNYGSSAAGGTGGSGIVIIRYKFQN